MNQLSDFATQLILTTSAFTMLELFHHGPIWMSSILNVGTALTSPVLPM